MMNSELERDVKSLIMTNINKKLLESENSSIADKFMTDIMAIGYNKNIESAIDDIYEIQKPLEFLTGKISRIDIEKRVRNSAARFKIEIGAFAQYFQLSKQGVSDDEIIAKVEAMLKSTI